MSNNYFISLGNCAAVPFDGKLTSCFVLSYENDNLLFDCGEGAQINLSKYKIKGSRIKYIFISHLHGDHVFGLLGFITSLSLQGRKEALNVFGPQGLKDFIENQLKLIAAFISYPLNIEEFVTNSGLVLLDIKKFKVTSFPLLHRIESYGYVFEEKPKPLNIIPEKIKTYNLSIDQILKVKKGADIVFEGKKISNKELTLEPDAPIKFSYCSDTSYLESIIPFIKNSDILYHESTFLEIDKTKAIKTGHSTAVDAAKIALKANVKKLLLGHFSSRYESSKVYEEEGQKVFKNTIATEIGEKYFF